MNKNTHALNGNVNTNKQMAQRLSGFQTLLQPNNQNKSHGEVGPNRKPRRKNNGQVLTQLESPNEWMQRSWTDWYQNGWASNPPGNTKHTGFPQGVKLKHRKFNHSASRDTTRSNKSEKSTKSARSNATTMHGGGKTSSVWGYTWNDEKTLPQSNSYAQTQEGNT